MRPTTIFVIFTIGAIGSLFYIGNKMGVPTPKMPELKLPEVVTNMTKEKDESGQPVSGFYKWQDNAGNWHYGDKPPQGTVAQSVDVDVNRNVLASPKKEEPKESVDDIPGMDNMPGIAGSMGQAQKLMGMDPMERQKQANE